MKKNYNNQYYKEPVVFYNKGYFIEISTLFTTIIIVKENKNSQYTNI